MNNSSRRGLSILAGGLAFVGSANSADLIVNGSFEEGPGVGWVGHFRTYNYSAAYYRGPAIPESENPGGSYSWQHGIASGDYTGPCVQTVDLTAGASAGDIDAGRAQFTFSAWMASYGNPGSNPERPYVTMQFFDAANSPLGSVVALDRSIGDHFIQFADGVTAFDASTHEHFWGKYRRSGPVPPGARTATVGITRSPNAPLSGTPDSYTDLVKLDVAAAAVVPPAVVSTAPAGSNVRPDAAIKIILQDGSTQVDTSNLQLTFDGGAVTPTVNRTAGITTIEFDPPGLLAPVSSHSVQLIFADNGAVPVVQTNQFNFTVFSYYNLLLPSPLHFEDFESNDEGVLPAGWTQQSFTPVPDSNVDFSDLYSAPYAGWTVVNSSRFNDPLLTYATHTPETDYRRVLSANSANVVNGVVFETLAQGKIAFGNSGYRDSSAGPTGSQVMYMFSKDFDLTGQNNVYLSFHSLWEQNQDSIGAVEYSIDEGATWLPVVYYLENGDVVRDGSGAIDAAASFGTVRSDIATYTDPNTQEVRGGFYGAFIGVDSSQWNTLGDYIRPGVDDNAVLAKRIELIRLPAADNQSKVRLRFAHAGTDSWYFGIDNVGLYSLSQASPPVITGPTPGSVTDAVGNSVRFDISLLGTGPYTFQWLRDGTALSGQTSQGLSLSNIQSTAAGGYSVVVGYLGGSVTSSVATLSVFQPEAARVALQWDFAEFNETATLGADVDYFDSTVFNGSYIVPTDVPGLPQIGGENINVMHVPSGAGGPSGGYLLRHGLSANGGGTNVNQYTLIVDVLYPAGSHNLRRALLQTQPQNTDDSEFRFDENNALGVNGVYHGRIQSDTWHRIALAVDLAGPGPHPVVAKFIDGVKVGQQVLTAGVDGRWSLSTDPFTPYALLFGGLADESQEAFVSSVQLRAGRLSDAAIAAMGGPTPGKIPGAVGIKRDGPSAVLRWSGSTLLQAPSPTGPWTPVDGAAKPFTIPAAGGARFYRSN